MCFMARLPRWEVTYAGDFDHEPGRGGGSSINLITQDGFLPTYFHVGNMWFWAAEGGKNASVTHSVLLTWKAYYGKGKVCIT